MNWMEQLLIIGGVSLDIFAAMECQGSMVAKIEKIRLGILSLLVCFWQAALFFAGQFLASFLIQENGIAEKEQVIGAGIAMIIYAGLGAHLVAKAARSEVIREHREEHFDNKRISLGLLGTGAYTLLSGLAFGFLESDVASGLFLIAACAILAVVAGSYAGYHFGFAQRRKAYGIAAALLWIAGLDILWRIFIS